MVSVIIPIYNEEKFLSENSDHFIGLARAAELIFVDGGSSDKSVQVAEGLGRVLYAEKCRALQMNIGARSAGGDVLFFLHADNYVSPGVMEAAEKMILEEGFIGGCLTQFLDEKKFIFRIIEGFGNIRARLTKVFYGDQGIFVDKDIFFRIGGFPVVPIMEDVLFTKKLRKYGRTTVLKDKIIVSSRRWTGRGIIRTTLLYSILNVLAFFGMPLDRIKAMYEDIR